MGIDWEQLFESTSRGLLFFYAQNQENRQTVISSDSTSLSLSSLSFCQMISKSERLNVYLNTKDDVIDE